jgi:hypothetical protein
LAGGRGSGSRALRSRGPCASHPFARWPGWRAAAAERAKRLPRCGLVSLTTNSPHISGPGLRLAAFSSSPLALLAASSSALRCIHPATNPCNEFLARHTRNATSRPLRADHARTGDWARVRLRGGPYRFSTTRVSSSVRLVRARKARTVRSTSAGETAGLLPAVLPGLLPLPRIASALMHRRDQRRAGLRSGHAR